MSKVSFFKLYMPSKPIKFWTEDFWLIDAAFFSLPMALFILEDNWKSHPKHSDEKVVLNLISGFKL